MLRIINVLMLILLLGVVGAAQAALTPVFEYSFPASYDGTGDTVTDLNADPNGGIPGNNATLEVADSNLIDTRPSGFDSSLMSINGVHRGELDTTSLLDSQSVAAAGGFTFDVWLKWDGTSHQKAINYGNADMIKTYNSDLYFMLGSSVSPGAGIKFAGLTVDTWYHVVAIFDTLGNAAVEDTVYPGYYMVAGEMSLYVNGNIVDSKSATKTTMGDRNGTFAIGAHTNMVQELWAGAIFNPGVYLGVPGKPAYGPTPEDGSNVVFSTDTVSWINPDPKDPSAPITSDVYFSDSVDPEDPDFAVLADQIADDTTDTSATIPASYLPLDFGQTYYWRVDVTDPNTGETVVGPVWGFTAYPEVDAGDDIFTWLVEGSTVETMSPNLGTGWPGTVTYAWSVIAGDTESITITDPAVENAEVTITATGGYELELVINGNSELSDTIAINVYDTACLAAQGSGIALKVSDLNEDCLVNLEDFAMFAYDWMSCTSLDCPSP